MPCAIGRQPLGATWAYSFVGPCDLQLLDGDLVRLVLLPGWQNLSAQPLVRDDGTPAHDHDVLSVQPDGELQARPAGANGPYERAILDAPHARIVAYQPKTGFIWAFAFLPELPPV